MSVLALLAFSVLSSASADEAQLDTCATLIPPALAARLNADMNGYRLPNSNDAGADRTRNIAATGDWPCPFVVIGDFDGNGSLDRALLLPARSGTSTSTKLVAALNMPGQGPGQGQGQWQLSLNDDWPLALTDSELRPMEPGLYQRSDAIAQPAAQLDQSGGLQADFTSFRAGNPQGDHTIFAFINNRWMKLAMSP